MVHQVRFCFGIVLLLLGIATLAPEVPPATLAPEVPLPPWPWRSPLPPWPRRSRHRNEGGDSGMEGGLGQVTAHLVQQSVLHHAHGPP